MPNVVCLFFSLWGKSAEWWEGRQGWSELVSSLKLLRISHRTSAQFFIGGRDCFKGARHCKASLRTCFTALMEAGLLLSLGSMANTASPCFNNFIAYRHTNSLIWSMRLDIKLWYHFFNIDFKLNSIWQNELVK